MQDSSLEKDPSGKDPHSSGAKLDAGKPKVSTYVLRYFPRALMAIAEVSEHGATKYTPGGWKHVENGVQRYEDAEVRHILKEAMDGSWDSDSDLLHVAHKAWNALATLELRLKTKEKEATWGQLDDILQSTPRQQDSNGEEEIVHSVSQPATSTVRQDVGVHEWSPLLEKFYGPKETLKTSNLT